MEAAGGLDPAGMVHARSYPPFCTPLSFLGPLPAISLAQDPQRDPEIHCDVRGFWRYKGFNCVFAAAGGKDRIGL